MECWVWVVVWVVIAIILTIAVMGAIVYGVFINARDQLINEFTRSVSEYCQNLVPITYESPLVPPAQVGVYEKSVAQNLVDASVAVSQSNRANVVIMVPPPFTNFQKVVGIDPASGEPSMFCYIFWGGGSEAAIVFTGTVTLSQWEDDFNFQLVPATSLNGVPPGSSIMVHGGFYGIYQAIRSQLWDWWETREVTPRSRESRRTEGTVSHSTVRTLFITGHSLGGALSTICAFDFAGSGIFNTGGDPSPLPTLIHQSFAAPRSGNIEYAQRFDELVPTSLRINNTEDIIPQLPPSVWRNNLYLHTNQNVPFTVNRGTLEANHTTAYLQNLPDAPECGK